MGKKTTDVKIEGGRFTLRWNLQWISLAILIIGLVACVLPLIWPNLCIVYMLGEFYTPYFLSTIAQSLAAVLALVFTATLIVAQLSSRYSHRALAQYFDIYTVSYICIFVVAVLLPIWLLSSPSMIGINASFILAVLCLVLLVPYFLRFRYMLSPEYLLRCVTDQTLKKLRANATVEPQDLVALSDIVMSAYNLKDYETFRKGMQCLSTLFSEILRIELQSPKTGEEIKDDEFTGVPSRREYQRIFVRGKSISLVRHAIERRIYNIAQAVGNDPITPEQIIEALEIEAKDAIKDSRSIATEIIMYLIQQITATATSKGSESHGYAAIESFEAVGLEALGAGQARTVNEALFQLSWIGVQAYNARLSKIVKNVVYFIERIGTNAGGKKILSCAIEAASRLFFLFGMTGLGDHSIPLFDENQQQYYLKDDVIKSLRSIKSASQTEVIKTAFQNAIALKDWVVGPGAKEVGVKYCKMVENIYEGLSTHQ